MARLSHLRHPGRVRTEAARRAAFERFVGAVDPDRRLRPVERERRSQQLRSAWAAHLAYHRVRGSSPGRLDAFLERYAPAAPDAPDTDEAGAPAQETPASEVRDAAATPTG